MSRPRIVEPKRCACGKVLAKRTFAKCLECVQARRAEIASRPCADCGGPQRYPKAGLCGACWQTRRRRTAEGQARSREASRRWYAKHPSSPEERKEKRRIFIKQHPLWPKWVSMRRRCAEVANNRYAEYGGRGIRVCPEWDASYKAFEAWMFDNLGPCPQGHSLDRINNDGHYEPGNLRWATARQQLHNTRPRLALKINEDTTRRIHDLIALADACLRGEKAA